MRLAVLLAGLMLIGGSAASAQSEAEAWCAGLLDHLDQETVLEFRGPAADVLRDGCVDYLIVSSPPDVSSSTNRGSDAAGSESLGSFREFSEHALDSMGEVNRLAKEGQTASSLEEIARSFEPYIAWAEAERRWLEANLPDECWAHIHEQWRQGLDGMEAAAQLMINGLGERDLDQVDAASADFSVVMAEFNEIPGFVAGLDC